jgi:RimJ/RimL family protein N-acetyltransferase
VTPWEYSEPLRTERLELRLLTLDDVDDVLDWMSDPVVAEYQLYEPRSREQVIEHIEKVAPHSAMAVADDYVEFGIVLPASAEDRARVIGCIYFPLKSVDDETAEIGWALTKRYQGKGYAFEAAAAVLELAFETIGLHRVYAELDPRNAASIALCLRLGMREEAHFVEHMMFKGAWADTGVYGILEREWRALP